MFYQSIKQAIRVFYCFSPDYPYIMKQMKKLKSSILCDKTLWTFAENTQEM